MTAEQKIDELLIKLMHDDWLTQRESYMEAMTWAVKEMLKDKIIENNGEESIRVEDMITNAQLLGLDIN